MVAISDNVIGFDPTDVYTAAEAASGIKPRPWKTGQTVQGDDGNRYQYARASASIAANNTVANITLVNGVYQAAASGGDSANASGQALVSGDYAWFRLA